ncbi:hypothetical protein [Comamonas koreensis]|uniref:Uncharacterized protein n=1 Tax=Comamonas koreensis TaxID=160825 RepID=A0AAW4Y3Z6_9BURK|nr:hypothetical protein [Comamonas koreensis]MCD2167916.1 hypothetical protein [Comamonas koreensis]
MYINEPRHHRPPLQIHLPINHRLRRITHMPNPAHHPTLHHKSRREIALAATGKNMGMGEQARGHGRAAKSKGGKEAAIVRDCKNHPANRRPGCSKPPAKQQAQHQGQTLNAAVQNNQLRSKRSARTTTTNGEMGAQARRRGRRQYACMASPRNKAYAPISPPQNENCQRPKQQQHRQGSS